MSKYPAESDIRAKVINELVLLRNRHQGQSEGEDGLTLSVRKSLYRDCWFFYFAFDAVDPEWTPVCVMPYLGGYAGKDLAMLADDIVRKVLYAMLP